MAWFLKNLCIGLCGACLLLPARSHSAIVIGSVVGNASLLEVGLGVGATAILVGAFTPNRRRQKYFIRGGVVVLILSHSKDDVAAAIAHEVPKLPWFSAEHAAQVVLAKAKTVAVRSGFKTVSLKRSEIQPILEEIGYLDWETRDQLVNVLMN